MLGQDANQLLGRDGPDKYLALGGGRQHVVMVAGQPQHPAVGHVAEAHRHKPHQRQGRERGHSRCASTRTRDGGRP